MASTYLLTKKLINKYKEEMISYGKNNGYTDPTEQLENDPIYMEMPEDIQQAIINYGYENKAYGARLQSTLNAGSSPVSPRLPDILKDYLNDLYSEIAMLDLTTIPNAGKHLVVKSLTSIEDMFEEYFEKYSHLNTESPAETEYGKNLLKTASEDPSKPISRIGRYSHNQSLIEDQSKRAPLTLMCSKDGQPYIQINNMRGEPRMIEISPEAVPYYDLFLRSFSVHLCGVKNEKYAFAEAYEDYKSVPDWIAKGKKLEFSSASLEEGLCLGMSQVMGSFHNEQEIKYLMDFLSLYLSTIAEDSVGLMINSFESQWGESIYQQGTSQHTKFSEFMSEFVPMVSYFSLGERMQESLCTIMKTMAKEGYDISPANIENNVSKLGNELDFLFSESLKDMGMGDNQ